MLSHVIFRAFCNALMGISFCVCWVQLDVGDAAANVSGYESDNEDNDEDAPGPRHNPPEPATAAALALAASPDGLAPRLIALRHQCLILLLRHCFKLPSRYHFHPLDQLPASPETQWAAYYSNCHCQVAGVTSGTRLMVSIGTASSVAITISNASNNREQGAAGDLSHMAVKS